MARVHIVGNSVGYGFSDNNNDWPSLVKQEAYRLREKGVKPRLSVVNLSSPGNMLIHYLDSGLFSAFLACNTRGRQVGIFCVGACEAAILRSRGAEAPRRSLDEFAGDLSRLCTTINDFNSSQPQENHTSAMLLGIRQ